jgi:hypothetical protein
LIGGADNRFIGCYFGGGGMIHQVSIEGSTYNQFIGSTNDNTYGHAYRFTGASSSNAIIGGSITSPSQNATNTYDGISFEDDATGNRVIGVQFHNPRATVGRYAVRESGSAGANIVIGCSFGSGWGAGVASLRVGGGSRIVGAVGYSSPESFLSGLSVQGQYTGSAPTTASTPTLRVNEGGALSLWAGGQGYNSMWLQSIQDDGNQTVKPLVLQPLGGAVQVTGQLTVSGASGSTLAVTTGAGTGSVATTMGSNAPPGATAGNPVGWIRINVGGTDRYIPYL